MAFEDLLDGDARVIAGETFTHTIGASLRIPVAVVDSDDTLMSFASGYTATMTLNGREGANIATFTNTLAAGRVIDLNPSESGASLVIRSTPVGLSALSSHVNRPLIFNLLLTRTSDGLAVDVMRGCYLYPTPQHN